MPWKKLNDFDLNSELPPSFMPNNLVTDGQGRMAFAAGNQVRCTKRIFNCPARSDFSLAYSEKLDVTSVCWWSGIQRYNRPLLVLATESSTKLPATVQVWNTARGNGSRLFRCNVNDLESLGTMERKNSGANGKAVQFARGLAQVSAGSCGPPLFCGSSDGGVYGIYFKLGKEGGFKSACTIRDLSHPIMTLSGDVRGSSYLAGADESGKMVVWNIENGRDEGGKIGQEYTSSIIYEYSVDEDLICCIGMWQNIVFAGHNSGYLTAHDVKRQVILASVVTNAKCITCIDVYKEKELVLVCGEDCRVTMIGLSHSRGYRPVVHFSVALDSIVIGCALLKSPMGYPRMAVLTWEKGTLVQYEYEKSTKTDKKKEE